MNTHTHANGQSNFKKPGVLATSWPGAHLDSKFYAMASVTETLKNVVSLVTQN